MFPRWLSILVVVFFAYLLMQGGHGTAPVVPAVTSPEAPAAPKPHSALSDTLDLEHWKKSLNPDYAARAHCELEADSAAPALMFKMVEDAPGEGVPAKCMDTIKVQITIWNARGKPAYRDEVTLSLGAREIAAGLDAGLTGLRIGGIRTLILPPIALVHEKKTDAPKAVLNALRGDNVQLVTVRRIE